MTDTTPHDAPTSFQDAAESVIAKYPDASLDYARMICGRFPAGEPAMAESHALSAEYAHVIGGRFPAGEAAIAKCPRCRLSISDSLTACKRPGPSFTFVDLFAGIGGMRLGMERNGGQCVFSCEWDKFAQKTYQAWHGDLPHGDIREIEPAHVPDHDVLTAGFPCQPFSIAGVSKKVSMGKAHGFQDETQGTLFFYLADVIQAKRPRVIVLENVKNLMSHDGGRTWTVICKALDILRYEFFAKVIDAAPWVPQHRERAFIVGFDRDEFGKNPPFEFPEPPSGPPPKLRDILDEDTPEKYTLTDRLWKYLQDYKAKHRAAGNGFGFGMADLDGVSRTLSARYYKDGSEVLIPQEGRNPRRLSPKEAGRLMGFPEELISNIVVSDTQAYRQFGNAVVPLVVEAVGQQVAKALAQRPGGRRVNPLTPLWRLRR